MIKNKDIIGRREYVDFPELNLFHLEAKIDTGAYTSALHCHCIEENCNTLYFRVFEHMPVLVFQDYSKKQVKNSFGDTEERYIIKTLMILGKRKIRISLSLTDRSKMKYPVLLGRRALKGKFIVDIEKLHISSINPHS